MRKELFDQSLASLFWGENVRWVYCYMLVEGVDLGCLGVLGQVGHLGEG